VTCLATLLLASVALISAEEDIMEESPSDPRLFFGNVTANLLPVNVTLAAYGAAVIIGGSILGLAIYFLATQAKQYRQSSYNNYGYGYGNDQYSQQGGHQGHHASSRVDSETSEVMGMVGSALDNFRKVEDEEEENDFRVRRVKDFYNY